jgi:hypothetical protein
MGTPSRSKNGEPEILALAGGKEPSAAAQEFLLQAGSNAL